MSLTTKETIERIIFNECKDDPYEFEQLIDLINKLNESQLKELEEYLCITQVSTYQTIYHYAYELGII